jgi:hypothetical protein
MKNVGIISFLELLISKTPQTKRLINGMILPLLIPFHSLGVNAALGGYNNDKNKIK